MVRFTIPGEPKGKARPRFCKVGSHTRTYTPKSTTDYENKVKASYIDVADGKYLEGQIQAEIIGYFSIPKSTSKKKREEMLRGEVLHTKKIDADNLAKVVLDALNGIAYKDDSAICDLKVKKMYSNNPRVEVTIQEI